jgi:hypothetical protein
MIGEKQRRFVASAERYVAPHVQAAIVQLAEAYDYAQQTRSNPWEFAMEIDVLKALGLSLNDLRWLLVNGYAKCGWEVTKQADTARKFRRPRNENFTKKTCFVVTDAALRLTTTKPAELRRRRAA